MRFQLDGTRDRTFGGGGMVVLPRMSLDSSRVLAVDSQQRILLWFNGSSDPQLVRIDTGGRFDGTFGTDGRVALPRDLSDGGSLDVDAANQVAIAGMIYTGS